MLQAECAATGRVTFNFQTEVVAVTPAETGFEVQTNKGVFISESLVVATGGLSMPPLGATPFAWKLAEQLEINVIAPQAALVPFTLGEKDKILTKLTGTALPVTISAGKQSFTEALLFTHRGISGPAVLQISTYWKHGEALKINWLPHENAAEIIKQAQEKTPAQELKTVLGKVLPKKLVEVFVAWNALPNLPVRQLNQKQIAVISDYLHHWNFKPNGTEGYRTAEVTSGGVDTNELSSKTMQSNKISGLYFVGECMDVTGHLGGYNFQWAWSSGWVAGQNL